MVVWEDLLLPGQGRFLSLGQPWKRTYALPGNTTRTAQMLASCCHRVCGTRAEDVSERKRVEEKYTRY